MPSYPHILNVAEKMGVSSEQRRILESVASVVEDLFENEGAIAHDGTRLNKNAVLASFATRNPTLLEDLTTN